MRQNKTKDMPSPHERISALVDGQLQDEELDGVLVALASDEAARARWQLYHLVGDTLRAPGLAAVRGDDEAFLAGLRPRLVAEDPRLQPVRPKSPVRATPGAAANEAAFRWPWVAGLAAVAAVAWIGRGLIGGPGEPGAQLAQQTPAVNAGWTRVEDDGATARRVRDPYLDELLAAHRQASAGPALQDATGFLRNATFVPER